ncbi:hypothetical protein IWQ62_000057 [Dispira parvispora]|uniref:Peptidase S1 domain-containing protein n=1 Tax=Dispira parvispora TaxID=1520584 RepID=A0A9W8AVI1_9FUNG|nr:hypothetical protein IWQ62_000057 [Dispira parvispora]
MLQLWQLVTWSVALARIVSSFPDSLSSDSTTQAQAASRIIGGEDAQAMQFPFMAHLQLKKGDTYSECGSTIISPEWIVTAAHCVTRKDNGKPYPSSDISFTVGILGDQLLNQYTATQVEVHPAFDFERVIDDIALVKVSPSIQFSDSVQAADVWTSKVNDGEMAVAIGWGSVDGVDVSQQASTIQYVGVRISNDRRKCVRIDIAFENSNEDVICTANNPGRDTCQGDSGGPLAIPLSENDSAGNKYALLGITSYGYSPSSQQSCGAQDGIAFYTHVAYYLPFITSVTGLSEKELSVGDGSSPTAGSPSSGSSSTANDGASSTYALGTSDSRLLFFTLVLPLTSHLMFG